MTVDGNCAASGRADDPGVLRRLPDPAGAICRRGEESRRAVTPNWPTNPSARLRYGRARPSNARTTWSSVLLGPEMYRSLEVEAGVLYGETVSTWTMNALLRVGLTRGFRVRNLVGSIVVLHAARRVAWQQGPGPEIDDSDMRD